MPTSFYKLSPHSMHGQKIKYIYGGNMVSKEKFVKTMEMLAAYELKARKLEDAIMDMNPDNSGYISFADNLVVYIIDDLTERMEDKNEWIWYFVAERGYMTASGDCVFDSNGNPIPVNTWADVYDLITKEER